MEKNWNIKTEDMKELFYWNEGEGCIATDRYGRRRKGRLYVS